MFRLYRRRFPYSNYFNGKLAIDSQSCNDFCNLRFSRTIIESAINVTSYGTDGLILTSAHSIKHDEQRIRYKISRRNNGSIYQYSYYHNHKSDCSSDLITEDDPHNSFQVKPSVFIENEILPEEMAIAIKDNYTANRKKQ